MRKKRSEGNCPGVMMYLDTLQCINRLPEHDARLVMTAIEHYLEDGEIPQMEGCLFYLWPLLQQHMDNDFQHYQKICRKNQINGMISSFKRIYAPKNNLDPEDLDAQGDYLLKQGVSEEELTDYTAIHFSKQPSAAVSDLNQYQKQ